MVLDLPGLLDLLRFDHVCALLLLSVPRVRKQGNGIYVRHAELNHQPLDSLCFSVRQLMSGGELVLSMTENVSEAQLT